MILTIRTDKPVSEIALYEGTRQVITKKWQAHRRLAETIHKKIDQILADTTPLQGATLQSITGIVIYKGPGSFTGLRIGFSVANALAYSLGVPIVGSSGKNWAEEGISKLTRKVKRSVVLPEYGASVNVTKPKK